MSDQPGSFPGTGEPLVASFQKVLRPAVVEVLNNPFAAAELSDAVLAAKSIQHDADLLFSRR
jgi:hypothetical protein